MSCINEFYSAVSLKQPNNYVGLSSLLDPTMDWFMASVLFCYEF